MTDTRPVHRQAALTYAGLGLLVILITFAARLGPAGVENRMVEFSVGAGFVLVFGWLIYRGWWLISAVLIVSNMWRAITYVNDGLGLHVTLRSLQVTEIEPRPIAFVNALLMLVIVLMLARSAWVGFSAWRKRRLSSP
jgi:hypothetical protein